MARVRKWCEWEGGGGIGQTYVTWCLTLVSNSHVVERVILNVEDHKENSVEKSTSVCPKSLVV